jgi:hypothetical protein
MKKLLFISFAFAIFSTSCLFDNREEFYPEVTITNPTVFFAADVFPIIQAECVVCHGATSPSGGVSLNNYDNIKISADNGSLLGSLKGDGYQIMPQGGALPTAQIELVETWINEGALDN